jgi:hypothetical protein
MHISTDRPLTITWSKGSSPNDDASFVTSSIYLNDDKVSTPTRMSWDTGSQTASRFVRVTAAVSGMKSVGLPVVAALCPKTPYALPPGTVIGFDISIPSATDVTLTGNVVEFDNGATGVVIVSPYGSIDWSLVDLVSFYIFNNDGTGSTWASPGQIFDIGEIWFGTLQEFRNTTDPKRTLVDGVTNRRSHNNTNQPLFGPKPFYQWTYGFTPMPNASAYSGSAVPTYSRVEFAMSQARSMLIIGRIFTPGTTVLNADDIKFYTAFGRPATNGLQQMQRNKDGEFWSAGLVFETQPP